MCILSSLSWKFKMRPPFIFSFLNSPSFYHLECTSFKIHYVQEKD